MLSRSIPTRVLETTTQTLLKAYARFFDEFPDCQVIDRPTFWGFFKLTHPKLTDDEALLYRRVVGHIAEEPDPQIEAGIMNRLLEAAAAHDLAEQLLAYQNGAEIDLRAAITASLEKYDDLGSRHVKDAQVRDPIEKLLEDDANDVGLSWRLPCLNRCVKPIQGGDFIVVAGRPDKGKTTFLTDQLTHMAAQVDIVYPGENRSILWYNNEGPGKRIVTRAFQSALNVTMEELAALCQTPPDPGFERYGHKARQLYAQALGGRPGVLRIFDIHDWWSHEVEEHIKKYRPALVVFDMVDNIRFSGGPANGGERTDQLLEAMYQWARTRGVKYDCGVMATSQISADGDGVQYPTLSQLKDSKTGKQGAADVIITLGASNDPTLERSRFIGTTKNKRRRTGAPSSPRTEVMFNGDRGRYVEQA